MTIRRRPRSGSFTRETLTNPAQPEMTRLSGWGRAGSTVAQIVPVRSPSEVIDAYRRADDRGLLARGLGRSYGDAAQNAGGLVLSTTGLDAIGPVDHSSMTVRAGAGVSLGQLMRQLVPQGLALPVLPGTSRVSVGGAIACDVHGKNHLHVGSFASHVASLTLALSSGRVEVVTPDHPEVFWATAGGMGLTGVIVEATLRLRPISTAYVVTTTQRCAGLDRLITTMTAAAAESHYAVAWLDIGAPGPSLGRGVVESADAADPADVPTYPAPLRWAPPTTLPVPAGVPSGALSWSSVRALGEARWAWSARRGPARVRALATYLCPLDRVSGWHRFYGRSGLVQYQLAVPDGSEDVLARVLRRVAAATAPCAMAVLKRLGPQTEGYLSFPMAGWTLALDFPADTPGLHRLLDTLDQLAIDVGGRIYLAKDSRLQPGTIAQMYPRLADWQTIRRRLDPREALISDLARRIQLVTPGGHGA